jgi:hypothetical protein
MKNYQKFLEEITIKGSPGVPGEGDKKPGEREYLSDIERRAKSRLGITGREHPMQFGRRMMELIENSKRYIRGKERDLEKLAEEVILNNFGDILEGVELDIKIVTGNQIANFMQEESDESDEQPNFREIKDSELIRRIHKAKLGNVIIQGEAKNTKHILHSEEVREGIDKIFGNRSTDVFNTWDELSKLADKMDWIIPIDIKADMMERAPEGMAGAVKVDWKPKESKKDFDEKDDEDVEQDIDFEEESYTPIIKARGVDFPMLLHETVKGIFELIASVSQPGLGADPKEIEMAETVKLNVSSFEDEAEDFRTGPEIAADFRDFINQNRKSNDYPNIRAYIFGMMMDPNYMTSEEFLNLFRGILNKSEEARRKIDNMIDEIIEKLKKWELGEVLGHDDDEDDEDILSKIGLDDKTIKDSELSESDLKREIDNALDSGDMERFRKLSQEYAKRFPEK